jgi:tetratricopeptide (TPR) repeat protein
MRWCIACFLILIFNSLSGFSQKDKKLDSLISVYTKAESDTDRIYKYADIGSYLIDKGRYNEALPYFQKIIQTFSASYPKRGIDAKNKIALIYIQTEKYDKADSLAKEIIEESSKLKYPKGIGWATRNLGLINIFQGKYKDAVTYNLKALKIWEETKNQRMTAVSNSDLGIVFYYQGNYEKAAFYWENALKLKPDTTSVDYMADVANLSGAYVELSKYDKASEAVKKVLRYYSNDKKSEKYAGALNSLANIEKTIIRQLVIIPKV